MFSSTIGCTDRVSQFPVDSARQKHDWVAGYGENWNSDRRDMKSGTKQEVHSTIDNAHGMYSSSRCLPKASLCYGLHGREWKMEHTWNALLRGDYSKYSCTVVWLVQCVPETLFTAFAARESHGCFSWLLGLSHDTFHLNLGRELKTGSWERLAHVILTTPTGVSPQTTAIWLNK